MSILPKPSITLDMQEGGNLTERVQGTCRTAQRPTYYSFWLYAAHLPEPHVPPPIPDCVLVPEFANAIGVEDPGTK